MNSREKPTPELDTLVREALEPDAAAVSRTVSAALGKDRRPSSIPWIAAAAGAVALTVIMLVVRTPQPPAAPAPSAPSAPRIFVISNEGNFVTVTTPDGARFVVGKRG